MRAEANRHLGLSPLLCFPFYEAALGASDSNYHWHQSYYLQTRF
jgi:hypothetical protein